MRKGGVFYGMIFVVDGDQSKKLLAFSKMCLILSRATSYYGAWRRHSRQLKSGFRLIIASKWEVLRQKSPEPQQTKSDNNKSRHYGVFGSCTRRMLLMKKYSQAKLISVHLSVFSRKRPHTFPILPHTSLSISIPWSLNFLQNCSTCVGGQKVHSHA